VGLILSDTQLTYQLKESILYNASNLTQMTHNYTINLLIKTINIIVCYYFTFVHIILY
jgi:hypothetical protein